MSCSAPLQLADLGQVPSSLWASIIIWPTKMWNDSITSRVSALHNNCFSANCSIGNQGLFHEHLKSYWGSRNFPPFDSGGRFHCSQATPLPLGHWKKCCSIWILLHRGCSVLLGTRKLVVLFLPLELVKSFRKGEMRRTVVQPS